MSIMRYISLPRDVSKRQPNATYIKFGNDDKFSINPDASDNWKKLMPVIEGQIEGRINFWGTDIYRAIFNDCFKNPFVYELYVEVPQYYYGQKTRISQKYMGKKAIDGYMDYKEMDQELSAYWKKEWSLENQVLYKYLHDNLSVGEFAEIYTSWIEEEDERGMVFGPPTSETVINLKELLSLPYPMKTIEFGEREKLTIHKP